MVVAIHFRIIPIDLRELLHLNGLNKNPNKSSKGDAQRSDASCTHVDPITVAEVEGV